MVGVVPLRWPVLLGRMGDNVPRFLSGFEGQMNQALAATPGRLAEHTGFVASLADKEGEALQGAVEALVLLKVKESAGVNVDAHAPLMDSGVLIPSGCVASADGLKSETFFRDPKILKNHAAERLTVAT